MSSGAAPVSSEGSADQKRDAVEFEHDPHEPDAFRVRCTCCGEIAVEDDRAEAHSEADHHGLTCAPTGVTPVSRRETDDEPDEPEDTDGNDVYECARCSVGLTGNPQRECSGCGRSEWERVDDDRLIADGGRSPEERQAEALEEIAEEMRYQNAVLCELLSSMDDLAQRVDEHYHPDWEPHRRSGTALQTAVQDQLHERERVEDERLL